MKNDNEKQESFLLFEGFWSNFTGYLMFPCWLLMICYGFKTVLGDCLSLFGFVSMLGLWTYRTCREYKEFKEASNRLKPKELTKIRLQAFMER